MWASSWVRFPAAKWYLFNKLVLFGGGNVYSMKSSKKIYSFHVQNLRSIEIAMNCIALSMRKAISQEDKKTIFSFTRLYALLLGTWSECRFNKLIYEPVGFSHPERSLIRSKGSQLDRWLMTIELAFRKHYNVKKAKLSDNNLPHSAFSRLCALSDLILKDLRIIIELRNKLAHGQWVYPLNNEGNDVVQEQFDSLRNENILSLQFKKKIIAYLSDSIHDLVVSRPTFERDFDMHYRLILETRRNLTTRDYLSYKKMMRKKYKKGISKRAYSLQ